MPTKYGNGLSYSLQEMGDKINPFVKYLLESEPRVRLHPLADDLDDKKFFFITKKNIHIPYALPEVEHEIAHAVEMTNPSRWTLPDWGMAETVAWNNGLTARRMFAAMSREIRVRAIQLHMSPPSDTNNRSSLVNILNNEHAWGPWAEQFTPYGRFKNYQDVWDWANDLRARTYNAWSLDRIHHEWMIRLTHMQHWMESKEAA